MCAYFMGYTVNLNRASIRDNWPSQLRFKLFGCLFHGRFSSQMSWGVSTAWKPKSNLSCSVRWDVYTAGEIGNTENTTAYSVWYLQENTRCWCFHIKSAKTHCGRDKMDGIFQTPFSNAFSWMKKYEFQLRFHWSLFLKLQLTILQHCFR